MKCEIKRRRISLERKKERKKEKINEWKKK